MDWTGKYYFLDGVLYDCTTNKFTQPEGIAFYEVIRTSNGIPWFFDDHMQRLENGISSRYHIPARLKENIRSGICALTAIESYLERNLRVTVTLSNDSYKLHICFVESSYPDRLMYENGVSVITIMAERHDPGVKILNAGLRNAVNEQLKNTGTYEALLVNENGIITEGSRSNVFFIDYDNNLLTSPDYLVLPGVTRKHVKEICLEENINLIYREVPLTYISGYKSVFITGTSPMILPVQSINDHLFDTINPLIGSLRKLYIARAADSIEKFKREAQE